MGGMLKSITKHIISYLFYIQLLMGDMLNSTTKHIIIYLFYL